MKKLDPKKIGISDDGQIYVYVPDWMSEEGGNEVTDLMEQITGALTANNTTGAINGAYLAIALVNVATGVLADGLRKSGEDPDTMVSISAVAETLSDFTAAFSDHVASHIPEGILRLIRETEGNA
jgi:hypothetical protein